jgi:hypothetical protein
MMPKCQRLKAAPNPTREWQLSRPPTTDQMTASGALNRHGQCVPGLANVSPGAGSRLSRRRLEDPS